jgi:acyl-CoA thioesterase YciA
MDDLGHLTIQTLAMPGDTNANGDIFGGWLVSQMDLAAGVMAKSMARGRVVTVAIDGIHFVKPVKIGDVVSCYVKYMGKKRTSMRMEVQVWTDNYELALRHLVAKGNFIFVAVDELGKPRPVED